MATKHPTRHGPMTVAEAARRFGIRDGLLRKRLRHGSTLDEALHPDEDRAEALAMVRAGDTEQDIAEWLGWTPGKTWAATLVEASKSPARMTVWLRQQSKPLMREAAR